MQNENGNGNGTVAGNGEATDNGAQQAMGPRQPWDRERDGQ